MSELGDTDRRSELQREALARVQRLVGGEATEEDVGDTKRWQRLSPAHADAFRFASRLWDRLGPAGRNVLERRAESVLFDRPPIERPGPSRRAVLGGAATAAVFVSGLSSLESHTVG